MNTTTLKMLLTEYDKKRRNAEKQAEEEKKKLYAQHPDLVKIDQELSSFAIQTAKLMLSHPDEKLIDDLKLTIEARKKQKQQILASIGKTENDLLPHYECQKCQDTGYVLEANGSQSMCSCLKQQIYNMEYNKSNMSHIEAQDFGHFNLTFYSNEVNREKYHSTVSPKENIQLILDICHHFIQNFDDVKEKNLLFTGKTGLGKTFLSSCIANELMKQGKTVLYQTASNMLDSIIDYRFGKANVSKDIYDYLLNVDLLIIDDLGTEGPNSMKLTELFNLLNSRLLNINKITKTIISTNLSLQTISQTYDERIVSRMIGGYNICYFFGDDIRFKKQN